MTTKTPTRIGDHATAEAVAHHHIVGDNDAPDGVEQIGCGSHRTVYLDHGTDVVYKIGINNVNRQEVETLDALRARGVDHAPAAHLYEVTVNDPWDDSEIVATVVAMPYLPDDGSVAKPYPILEGACDLNPHGNVVANGGQLWLIDAGGL